MVRVAVVDDQPLYRDMLVRALADQEPVRVVVEAAGVEEALRLVPGRDVDVAVLDLDLRDGNGIALGIQLRRTDPRIGIMLLSGQDHLELLLDLPADVRRGWSYLSKSSPLSSTRTVVEAVVATAQGRTVLDPVLVEAARPRAGSATASLSPRQREVLRLAAQGLANAGIAEQLSLSVRSVENHLYAVYAALDVPADHNARVSAVLRFIEDTARG